MPSIRILIRDHRLLAMLLVIAVLSIKLLVPQGYMVGMDHRLLSVQLCLDGIHNETVKIAISVDGKSQNDSQEHGGSPSEHCAFSSLSMGALDEGQAFILAIVIAFILALGFAPIYPVLRSRTLHLRPPLRGPPALF